jgi:signal transduction histidine kinase
MSTPFHQRLYLRIWLAVVATIVVLALGAGWLARMELEHERADRERERAERPGREIVLRNQAGDVVGQAPMRAMRQPGQGPEFQVTMVDGTKLFIQLPRPGRPPAMGDGPGSKGGMGDIENRRYGGADRLPFSFAWMLGLVALAVALGTYPIVRRLTKRLETVQLGVERWGQGDLSTRLPEDGQDEVAFLAKRFNHAAQQIETLLTDQKALLVSQKSLLANASHELRSPLTRIRMGLELMGLPAGTNSSPSFKEEISRNIAELDQLIEEILLASRLDAREADMGTVETVDLVGLAAEECARVNADLDAQLEASAGQPGGASELVVHGVSKLLRRALRNLLENARRHASGGPAIQGEGSNGITVTLRQEGGKAIVTVCDRGPGVPPALRERIFEPFYRLPGATERDGGVGLGLSLVKSIAIRHGGTVMCENNPQGGACFVIRLPLWTKDQGHGAAG